MNANKKLTIVLASGGTGGHIFPAEALAEELAKRGHKAILITDARRKQYSFSDNQIDVHVISTISPKNGRIKAIAGIFVGLSQSFKLLRKIKPDVVIGFGGYPSLPTMLAALILNI